MNDYLKLCAGKRLHALKQMKLDRCLKIRAQLPVLTREDIVRHRLPPHEALLRAIRHDGMKNTAEYIKQLIDYQEYIRNFYGPDTNIWMRPRLMENIEILYHLKEGLAAAEKAHVSDNIGNEIREILKLAVEYATGEEDWWWLGHQLLDQAIIISKDYHRDGGMYHSIARYALGKFLLDKVADVDAAMEHLNIARSISIGHPWSAKGIYKTHQNTVFTEVSILLFKVILKQARQCMKTDPHMSIKLCITARKAARDGCYYSGETEAYITKGECELAIYDTQNAITSFQKALSIQNFHEEPYWKCEAMSHLAIAYLKHGLLTSALQMLHDLKDYASKQGLAFYVAQAYKYLGEFYLREGTPENSTPLLKIALKLFNEGKYISEAESARNYAAISIGIELINPYIELIVACHDKNPDYENLMKRLIEWKDSRVTFWEDVKGEISFGKMDETKHLDEIDFQVGDEDKNPMANREMVLSVQTLDGINDSLVRDTAESTSGMTNITEDMSREGYPVIKYGGSGVTDITDKRIDLDSGKTAPDDDTIITLHFTEGFFDEKFDASTKNTSII